MQANQPVEGFHQVDGFLHLGIAAWLFDLERVGGRVTKFANIEQARAASCFELQPVFEQIVAGHLTGVGRADIQTRRIWELEIV